MQSGSAFRGWVDFLRGPRSAARRGAPAGTSVAQKLECPHRSRFTAFSFAGLTSVSWQKLLGPTVEDLLSEEPRRARRFGHRSWHARPGRNR